MGESRSEARPTGCGMSHAGLEAGSSVNPRGPGSGPGRGFGVTPGCKADRDRYAGVRRGTGFAGAKTVQWTAFSVERPSKPERAEMGRNIAPARGAGRARSDLLWANLTGRVDSVRSQIYHREAGSSVVKLHSTLA